MWGFWELCDTEPDILWNHFRSIFDAFYVIQISISIKILKKVDHEIQQIFGIISDSHLLSTPPIQSTFLQYFSFIVDEKEKYGQKTANLCFMFLFLLHKHKTNMHKIYVLVQSFSFSILKSLYDFLHGMLQHQFSIFIRQIYAKQ